MSFITCPLYKNAVAIVFLVQIMENMRMNDPFEKPYDHLSTEDTIYKEWLDSGFFNPDECERAGIANSGETYTVVLPPPNVTGTLHTGHAYMTAIEDTVIRYHRMKGDKTLWLPGTDHAAIATQSKVEKILEKEGLKKRDMSREDFLARVNQFAQESHDTIISQLKKMGSSLDWTREAFTLDDKRSYAVRTAFKRLYDLGLIVQGERIINWDPKGQTTISDDEIVYREEKTKFYYFKYGPFTIGTARPETKFGDKYIVVHPTDERYAEFKHGDTFVAEWINGPITATVIKDDVIDPAFGTGAMTITPSHSMVDFEIAERHKLDKEQIIDKFGKLMPIAGEFAGMKIADAREKIVEKLNEKGLLVKVEENYVHNIATAERTGAMIEPQIMRQWFVAVEKPFKIPHSNLSDIKSGDTVTLKQLMRHVVENKSIEILPDRFEKIYFHWINNLHDWCISRQIWYGHRIPVWYKGSDTFVGIEAPEGDGWAQDEDTLDTWFSSGLWTFSTLGWPEETSDLKTFHPTALLETGYDIIFFWVARMILMTTTLVGDIPFKTVYLHGLVRDGQGRKMSKSLGNIVDPLVLVQENGADALRMAMLVGTGPGNDTKIADTTVRGYRKFGNKVWNVARFIVGAIKDADIKTLNEQTLSDVHKVTLSEWRTIGKDITADIENYRLYLATEKIYHYIWHTLADKIVEESKTAIYGDDAVAKLSTQTLLYILLKETLTVLHPFMPFVTEAIWKHIPGDKRPFLMVEKWPTL